MKVKVKELTPGFIPQRATKGAAAYDCYASWSTYNRDKGYLEVGLGFAIEVPDGYAAKLYDRSSVSNKGLSLANSVGIIDSDYRGEVIARFYPNASSIMAMIKDATHEKMISYAENVYQKGSACAQIRIEKNEDYEFEKTDELSSTERGGGGFGSTG